MTKTLLALTALLLLPSAARAATVDADIDRRQGTNFGPVTFKAARGEMNDVTVTAANGRLRFHDSQNPVNARGDCEQDGPRAAICPFTEDTAKVKLRNGADSASVEGLVSVRGGSGRDVLRGSSGVDFLNGQRGPDTLRGRRGSDDLTGGPGRDRLLGGGGEDDLIDGESDRRAASDVFVGGGNPTGGGADRGDTVDYSRRDAGLRINLRRGGGPGGDTLRGVESLVGGSGNDRLAGDGGDNWLVGRGGDDKLRGRAGDDNPQGGGGSDIVSGNAGADVLWGDRGADLLKGGADDDTLVARDGRAEDVRCGDGEDTAIATRDDTLEDCEIASSRTLAIRIQPQVQGNRAIYEVACLREAGCTGTLTLTSLDGVAYGSGEFTDLPHGADVFTEVEVDLTPEGRTALQDGQVIVVTYGDGDDGYRAFTGG